MRRMDLAPCCAALALAFSAPSLPAAEPAPAIARTLGVSAERLEAFRSTLSDFGSSMARDARDSRLAMTLQDAYMAPEPVQFGSPRRAFADFEDQGVPVGLAGRDLIFEEQFLLQGREGDAVDAAKSWLSRSLKGSDAHAATRGGRTSPKFGWDNGPVVGLRKGPLSASVLDGGWEVKWSRPILKRPGWVARVTAERDDGEERIAFSIGRSFRRATLR